MNIGELKEILSTYSDDIMVCVDGYEDGLVDLRENRIFIHSIRQMLKEECPLLGKYWYCDDQFDKGDDSVYALILSRYDKE